MKRLEKVERAAATAAASRDYLEKEIRIAVLEGLSLRRVAQAAGLSHEQVRRVTSK